MGTRAEGAAAAVTTPVRPIVILVAAAAAVMLVACGSGSRPTAEATPPPSTFASTVTTGTAPPTAHATATPVSSPQIAGEAAIVDVAFISPAHGWLARGTNGHGELLVTDDGGTSWKKQYTSEFAPELIQFVDANHGWLAGCAVPVGLSNACERQLFATHDGGNSWTPETLAPSAHRKLVALDFVSPQDGWVLADPCEPRCGAAPAELTSTLDSGTTWQPLALPEDATMPLSLKRLDTQTAWVLTESHLFSTGDGGLTWTTGDNPCHVVQPDWGTPFYGGPLDFVNTVRGWIGCTSRNAGGGMAPKTLYRTVDGGRTWRLLAETQTASIHSAGVGELSWSGGVTDIHFFDATTGWLDLDGPQSFLYRTDDGGQTWKPVDDGVGGGISHLSFTDAMHGWAWGGVLLRTTDAGAHWERVETPP